MTFTADSLASNLDTVYRYYLGSLTDDHQARIFARDKRANTRQLGAALARVGGSAWWLHREPSGPADDTPFVLASVDPATGAVRFDLATAVTIAGHPAAEVFRWDGGPLG